MHHVTRFTVVLGVLLLACMQIILLIRFFKVRRALSNLREQSSGDHERFRRGNNNPSSSTSENGHPPSHKTHAH